MKKNTKTKLSPLRFWFVVHFTADVFFAIPLLLCPTTTLQFFGWNSVDPLMTRLVAAALFGIGIESLIGAVKASTKQFIPLLNLKIIWSGTAILGLILSYFGNHPSPYILFLILVFAAFNLLWVYWRIFLEKQS